VVLIAFKPRLLTTLRVERAATKLKKAALIRRTGNVISIHRLLQQSLYCSLSQEEAQQAFDGAVKLINRAFPKSVNSRPLLDRWPACEVAIQHAMTLAKKFHQAANKKKHRLRTSPELQELMKNSVWYSLLLSFLLRHCLLRDRYLYEIGEFDDALKLLDMAYTVCPDKTTLVYAHLCNSAAAILFELNDLKKCKEMDDKAFAIRSTLLPEDDLDLAACFHNLGLLEGAQGRQDESMALIARAERARVKAGEEAIISLGLGHLIYGRAHFFKSQFQEARARYDEAGKIFARTLGPKSQFSAQLVQMPYSPDLGLVHANFNLP
jgi:tetratricopeptide (TPR) repeat protein